MEWYEKFEKEQRQAEYDGHHSNVPGERNTALREFKGPTKTRRPAYPWRRVDSTDRLPVTLREAIAGAKPTQGARAFDAEVVTRLSR